MHVKEIFLRIPSLSSIALCHCRSFSVDSSAKHLLSTPNDCYVIVSASRGIGLEFTKQLLERTEGRVIAMHRGDHVPASLSSLKEIYPNRLESISVDLENQATIDFIANKSNYFRNVKLLLNVAGVLGDGKQDPGPERSIENIDRAWLQKSADVNFIGHVMFTKALIPYFKARSETISPSDPKRIVNISARVGSISDNKLGGWYSYRMSKAALNMFTKTLSIEMKRHQTAVISMHPGTTDTDLSLPFQKNVKKEKLFSVIHSVSLMLDVIWNTKLEDTGKFLAYDGSEIQY